MALVRGDTKPAPQLSPGTIIEGRYRIDARVGVGGMGAVYQVTRLRDGRRLALELA